MQFLKGRMFISVILILLTILLVTIVIKYNWGNISFEKNQKKALVGKYCIDLNETIIDGYKLEDVKDLTLTLKADGTFSFNRDYPFIYDSIGIWIPRKPGLDEWNWIVFSKRSSVDSKYKMDCQFADSWKAAPVTDSTLILNSMTPKKGAIPIHVIYLKKINVSD